jgi:Zn-dependent protease with chaperone function
MPFLLMLFLTLPCVVEKWPEPGRWVGSPVTSVLLTWLGVLLEVGLAFAVSRRAQQLIQDPSASRDQILRGYSRGRLCHLIGLFATYTVALYIFGYGWAVQSLWTRPGGDLLRLAPFCVALLLSWTCFYDAERALSDDGREAQEELATGHPRKFWGRAAYVGFHFRQNLALVFLPIFLLLIEKELRRQFPALNQEWQTQASLVGIGIVPVVFLTMPWILRMVLGLQPLPEGPLRDRLMAAARRLRFRCSDILLWNTRGGVANAMVVGVFPFLRYVLLSDRLLEDLTPDEVEAVFGHEVGHVKHHHMLYYLIFLLASIFVLGSLALPHQNELDELLNLRERRDLAVLPVVGALGAYIFLVFGFLSRRCERQADIYGCRAVSCQHAGCDGHRDGHPLPEGAGHLCPTGIQTFIQALEKVALLNGMSRDKPGFLQSWQHSTIARRVGFLHSLLTDPRAERRFQRRVFLVKCTFLGVLALGLIVALYNS